MDTRHGYPTALKRVCLQCEANQKGRSAIMRLQRLAPLGALLAVPMFLMAPAASASTSHAGPRLMAVPEVAMVAGGTTFCQANTSECLNLTNCNTSKAVQLWDVHTGGVCSNDWSALVVGSVNPSQVWPFWCGGGLNSVYAGDRVFQVLWEPSGGQPDEVLASAGNNGTVTLESTDPGGDTDQGFLVEQDNNSAPLGAATRLIDPNTTCINATVQHLYAGCGGSGCLLREGQNPATGEYWDLARIPS